MQFAWLSPRTSSGRSPWLKPPIGRILFYHFESTDIKSCFSARIFSVESLAQELEAKNYRLEEWCDKGLAAIDAGLNKREGDPMPGLDAAMKRIGEFINVPIIVFTHPK
jgi:hypothetical protein